MKSKREAQPESYAVVWVEADFLRSPGLFHIVNTASLLPAADGVSEEESAVRAVARVGGVPLQGRIRDASSTEGGVRVISPKYKDLELTIPWRFIRAVATVEKARKKLAFVAKAALEPASATKRNGKSNSRT